MLDSLTPSPQQLASLETATATYQTDLDTAAASYLTGRGIGKQAATVARLGVCVHPAPGHERFTGMLSIPYIAANGNVVAIKFRALDPERKPKYDGPSQRSRLFNSRACAIGGTVIAVCEGELDAVKVQQDLGIPAVSTPGTTWFPHWARCFGDYDRVIVFADHDAKEDGSDPGLKHARKVVAEVPNAELVSPPAGSDVSEWLNQSGAEAVRKAAGL